MLIAYNKRRIKRVLLTEEGPLAPFIAALLDHDAPINVVAKALVTHDVPFAIARWRDAGVSYLNMNPFSSKVNISSMQFAGPRHAPVIIAASSHFASADEFIMAGSVSGDGGQSAVGPDYFVEVQDRYSDGRDLVPRTYAVSARNEEAQTKLLLVSEAHLQQGRRR